MQLFRTQKELLGCTVTIKVRVANESMFERAAKCAELAFEECERIESCYSRFIGGNELWEMNSKIGEWQEISGEPYELLAFGRRISEQCGGRFDLSVKGVLEGWGYDTQYSLAEKFPGMTGPYELSEGRVRLSAQVELGALGKGYALDRMMLYFYEFTHVSLDAGGDLLFRGEDWLVTFEDPRDVKAAIGQARLGNIALGASSPARRKWRNRHHLVQALDKKPADEMLGVFTQAKTGMLADAYSTALFVLGFEEARAFLNEKASELRLEALLVGPGGKYFKTEGFVGELF